MRREGYRQALERKGGRDGGKAGSGGNKQKEIRGRNREGGRIAQVTCRHAPGAMIVEAMERVAWKAALCLSDL